MFPVQKETENTFKSLVSGERIAIPRRVFTNLHKNGMYGVEVIHLSEENLQKAERLGLSLVLQSFRKRYWYKFGFKKAAPDHPAYSEGPSITLSSRTQKPSGQKAIVSLPTSSPTDSD